MVAYASGAPLVSVTFPETPPAVSAVDIVKRKKAVKSVFLKAIDSVLRREDDKNKGKRTNFSGEKIKKIVEGCLKNRILPFLNTGILSWPY